MPSVKFNGAPERGESAPMTWVRGHNTDLPAHGPGLSSVS